jgi:hypothetical protein
MNKIECIHGVILLKAFVLIIFVVMMKYYP